MPHDHQVNLYQQVTSYYELIPCQPLVRHEKFIIMRIADRIRPLREGLGMGRAEFCKKTGIKKPSLTSIELGRQRPTTDLLGSVNK